MSEWLRSRPGDGDGFVAAQCNGLSCSTGAGDEIFFQAGLGGNEVWAESLR